VRAEDVLHAAGAIWALGDDDWDEQARRLLRLLMDGLRFGAGGPQSGPPTPASV
jgi:hypothetical protein